MEAVKYIQMNSIGVNLLENVIIVFQSKRNPSRQCIFQGLKKDE